MADQPSPPRKPDLMFQFLAGLLAVVMIFGIFQGGVAFGNWLAGDHGDGGRSTTGDDVN